MRLSIVVLIVLMIAACGGDPGTDMPATETTASAGSVASTTSAGSVTTEPSDETGGVAPAEIHLAAHGAGASNTFGPSCSIGIHATNLNPIRVSVPDGWTMRGSGGGSGTSEVSFDVDGATVTVHVAAHAADRNLWESLEVGGEVGTADLAGVAVPIAEVSLGDDTGFGFVDVAWVTSLPETYSEDAFEMSVLVVADDASALGLAHATAVLSSVRVERCAAIVATLPPMATAGVMSVPEIVDDPLGKTRPDQDQPPYGSLVEAFTIYSLEQLAYLLPVAEPLDRCVAEALRNAPPPEFMIPSAALAPVQGGAQEAALETLIDQC